MYVYIYIYICTCIYVHPVDESFMKKAGVVCVLCVCEREKERERGHRFIIRLPPGTPRMCITWISYL